MAKFSPIRSGDATLDRNLDAIAKAVSGLEAAQRESSGQQGSAMITATGTSAARSLSERFADIINVKDFGATGDGTTDDTSAIQAALDAADPTLHPSAPSVVFFPNPSSFYQTTSPLRIPSGVTLRGSDRRLMACGAPPPYTGGFFMSDNLVVLKKTTNAKIHVAETVPGKGDASDRDCILYVDPSWTNHGTTSNIPGSVVIDGLSIVGAGPSLVDQGIFFALGGGLLMRNVEIAHVKTAFYGPNVWSSRFEGVHFYGRVQVDIGTSLTFVDCGFESSPDGFDGLRLTRVIYSTLINCWSDQPHESAFTFTGCNLSLIGCGAEGGLSPTTTEGTLLNLQGWNRIVAVNLFGYSADRADVASRPMVSVSANDDLTLLGGDFSLKPTPAPTHWQTTDIYSTSAGARVRSVGHLWLNGTSTTPAQLPAAPGYATVDADLYSTGSWTPVLGFWDGNNLNSVGVTYSQRAGTYTRQGNLVFLSGSITLTSKGSSIGSLAIGGLPFPNGTGYGLVTIAYQNNVTGLIRAAMSAGASRVDCYDATSTSSAALTNAAASNTTVISFTAIYQITGITYERTNG